MPRYKWKSPHEWLIEQIGSMDFPSVVSVTHELISKIDSDTLQDLFQAQMDEDGYFEDLDAPRPVTCDNCGEDIEPGEPRHTYGEAIICNDCNSERNGIGPYIFEEDADDSKT